MSTANDEKENLMNSTSKDVDEGSPRHCHKSQTSLKVYPQRWLMLFIFSLCTTLNGFMFLGLSAVANVASAYYNVSTVSIEWLANMGVLIFVFVSLPVAYLVSRYGVRIVLTVATGLMVLCAVFQYLGAGKDGYTYVLIGQFFYGVSYGSIVQIPGQLSANWFAPHERGMSTAIGVLMNILGVAVGFIQPSLMIPASNDLTIVAIGMENFFKSRLIVALIIFLVTLILYREYPPSPPSIIPDRKNLTFLQSLKMLYKDVNFQMVAQAFGINSGLLLAVAVVLSQLVVWRHGASPAIQHFIGWTGAMGDIAACASMLVGGFVQDRYSKHRELAIVLNAGSFIFWLVFALVLTLSNNLYILFLSYAIFAVFSIPYFGSGIEHIAEMTSPVPEGTSSSIVLILSNIYGFITIYAFGKLIESGFPLTTICLILLLYLLSTIFVTFAKTELKRSKTESTSIMIEFDWSDDEVDIDGQNKVFLDDTP
eukprot:TCONS_00055529-protein